MVNLSAYIRWHAQREPQRPALHYLGQTLSYDDLWQRTQRTAALLASRGIGADDVVAVMMKNSAAFMEIALAVSHLGAVFLPLNFRLAREEVDYILDHAGAVLVLADDDYAELLAGREPILLDAAAQSDSTRLVPPGLPAPPCVPRQPDDIYRLMYTSGTTDRPKGVVHTYQNFYFKNMEHAIVLGYHRDTRALVVGPLYHVGGSDAPGFGGFWFGAYLVLLREFDEQAVFEAIDRHRLEVGWMAPAMINRLLTHPERDAYDISHFQSCLGGGEKTPLARIRSFQELFSGGRYIDAYGLTESCAGDTFMEPGRELEKAGSTGTPTPHVQVEIRDESGAVLPAGEEGEVCLRGPKITGGYLKDPARNAASFFDDGWFRTGDVGYLDDEGFLYLTDRKKDMIISGGENIASSEVERVIYELPQVAECAVIGVPDERWGERPEAVVTLRPGTTLDLETLQRHCREHLAGFKLPKALHQIQALPRNPSGKVLKRVLREQFAAGAG